jgi:hypothetical protein
VLLLAPASNGLAPEDMEVQSLAEAGEVVASDAVPADAPLDRLGTPVVTPVALVTETATVETAVDLSALPDTPLTPDQVLALADQIAAGATPMTALTEGTTAPVALSVDGQAVAAPAAITLIDSTVPGVAVAYRPPARPGTLSAPVAPVTEVSAGGDLVTATPIPAGTALVQLGAYDTPEIAAVAWEQLGTRFAEFMTGKARVIQSASSNGVGFYRLRAMGFADLDDARRFCAVLDAENTDCVPVVVD